MKAKDEIGLISRMITILENICTTLAAIFLTVLLVIIAPATLSRYLLNYPFYFVEEFSGYLLVGMGFLGMAYGLKKGAHVTVNAVVKYLPYRRRIGLELLTTSIAICVVTILFWFSLKLCFLNFQDNVVSSTIMQTPLWIPQSFVWIGWLTFILSLVMHLIKKAEEFAKYGNVRSKADRLGH